MASREVSGELRHVVRRSGTGGRLAILADASRGDTADFSDRVRWALDRMAILVLPVSAAYLALALPAMKVIAPASSSPELLAAALASLGAGLFVYSAFLLLARAFYALGDSRVPALVALGSALVGAAVEIVGVLSVDDPSARVDAGLDVDDPCRTRIAERELLGPRPDDLDGSPGRLRQPGRFDRVFAGVLAAIRGSGIGHDDPHLALRHVEGLREFAADAERPLGAAPDRQGITGPFGDGRTWLDPVEVTGLLATYSIPIAPALLARSADEARVMLSPGASLALRELPAPPAVLLLVGPEGGLDADEQHTAASCGFRAVRLGPRILRTETAALAAVAAMHALWGDF